MSGSEFAGFGVVVLLLGVPALLGGIIALRFQSRVRRVRVEGVVVHYTNWMKPARVVFDYPLPDGRWARAERISGFAAVQSDGLFVRPGHRIQVWVDPMNPADVSLGDTGSAGG